MKNKSLVIIISLILFITFILIILINYDKILTAFVINDFKVGVFAICEEREDYVYCKDEIFASCNNNLVYVKEDFVTCNGKIYEIQEMDLEETELPKDWKDPRQKNFLQLWTIQE
jgi:hypothetical protein